MNIHPIIFIRILQELNLINSSDNFNLVHFNLGRLEVRHDLFQVFCSDSQKY